MRKSNFYTVLEHLIKEQRKQTGIVCYRCRKRYKTEAGLEEHKRKHLKIRLLRIKL